MVGPREPLKQPRLHDADRIGRLRDGNANGIFAAALVYGVIHTTAYGLSPNTWQMSLGIALLVLIVFLPEGLFSRLGWR